MCVTARQLLFMMCECALLALRMYVLFFFSLQSGQLRSRNSRNDGNENASDGVRRHDLLHYVAADAILCAQALIQGLFVCAKSE